MHGGSITEVGNYRPKAGVGEGMTVEPISVNGKAEAFGYFGQHNGLNCSNDS